MHIFSSRIISSARAHLCRQVSIKFESASADTCYPNAPFSMQARATLMPQYQ